MKTRHRLNTSMGKFFPITVEQPRNCGREQQAVIAILAQALHDELTHEVNYDHVKLTFPRGPVPIHYRNHRFDVAARAGDRVILIDVYSVDVRYWLQGEVTDSGESQE
jgi:hypothetical protein